MAIDTEPCRFIELEPTAAMRDNSAVLFETSSLRLVRIHLGAGQQSLPHVASGEVLIECHRGCVAVETSRGDQSLRSGQAVHLAAGVKHSLRGKSDCSLLVMNLAHAQPRLRVAEDSSVADVDDHGKEPGQDKDIVQQASEESFPASDPPSWTQTSTS